jgi:hypothetical protein
METTQENNYGDLTNLALITDGIQKLFPTGLGVLIYELNVYDFYNIKKQFPEINENKNRFKIDISGVEVVFILKGSIEKELTKLEEEQTSTEVLKPMTNDSFLKKLLKLFSKKRS